jgi:menaquinone-dependent protoporphyrinogen oxidase
MAKVLILYGTTEGHTAKVASFVADLGRRAGHDVRVAHGASIGSDPDVAACDAILVAASVHEGRHQKYVRDWIVEHRPLLEEKPSAFLQVCLTSTVRDAEHDRQAEEVVEHMSADTGWKPADVAYVAGALKYTEYSWLKRMLMKHIAKAQGGDTDTSKDHEYTDWAALERWSEAFFEKIGHRVQPSG